MKSRRATVYIVDDDDAFRESLEELTGMLGNRVFGFASAEAFLKQPVIRRPACLLLDVFLPNIDGLQLQKKLLAKEGAIPIIFMSGHGNVPMSVNAMKNGAIDFLLKPFKTQELRRAILQALERDVRQVEKEAQRKKIFSRIEALTPREQDVMRQIITGKLNKQIAAVLGIEEKTVRTHRSRLMRKLKMSSVADLVRLLERVGIVHTAPGIPQ